MDYYNSPKIENYRFLYHSDYYDGPLSGMLLYKMKRYWFHCFDCHKTYIKEDWYRRFAVYELNAEDQAAIDGRHADFQALVGFTCDYIVGAKEVKTIYEEDEFKEYYDRKYPELDLSKQKCIGWFEQ